MMLNAGMVMLVVVGAIWFFLQSSKSRMSPKRVTKILWPAFGLFVLLTCGEAIAEDDKAILIEACNTQEGAGWLRKEYGNDYCACRAEKAKEALDKAIYRQLVEASRDEMKADGPSEREAIARGAFQAYAQAADAARLGCKKKKR